MKLTIRTILFILLGLILLLVGFVVFLKSEDGQKFVSKQVSSYLEDKLKTTVRANIKYEFPDWIALEKVFIADQSKDTLLIGDKIYADLDMWALIRNNSVKTNELIAENLTIKLNKNAKNFNFQFILDAFASDTTKPKEASLPLTIDLGKTNFKNLNLIYKDSQLNNQAQIRLKHFSSDFEKINLQTEQYYLKNTIIEGFDLIANFEKFEEKQESKSQQDTSLKTQLPDFKFQKLALKDIKYDVSIKPNSIKSKANITKLDVIADEFSLPKNKFNFKEINLSKSEISYQNTSQKAIQSGFDANNIYLKDLKFSIDNVAYSDKSITADVKNLSFIDKSGFNLQEFHSDVAFLPTRLSLTNLLIKTPQTTLKDKVEVQYESFEKLLADVGSAKVSTNLNQSKVSIEDVFVLMPTLKQNPELKKLQNEVFKISGSAQGKISDLNVNELIINGLGNTQLAVSGNIKNLPEIEKVNFQLFLKKLYIQKNTIDKFLPASTIPSNIELPSSLSLTGKISGSLKNIYTQSKLSTEFGTALFDGNITPTSTDGELNLQNFNIGKFLKQPEKIGEVSLKGDISVKNYDLKTMVLESKGHVEKAFYNNYNYQNVGFDAKLVNQILDFKTTSTDPSLSLTLNTQVDLSKPYPTARGTAQINKIDLQKLNFYADTIALAGNISFDVQDSNPDNFIGNISALKSVVYRDGKTIPIGDFKASLRPQNGILVGTLNSEFANLNLSTTTSQKDIVNAIFTEVNKYFALSSIPYKPYEKPYQFGIVGTLNNHPALQAFMPQLRALDSLLIDAKINNQTDTSLQLSARIPYLKLDSNVVKNLNLQMFGNGKEAIYNADLQEFNNGSARVRKANLKGEIANNVAGFVFVVKDSVDKPIHGIAGNLKSVNKHILIGFQPSGSLLNYANWNASNDGYIDYSEDGILVKNLMFSSENQLLRVNSIKDVANAPLKIQAENLDVKNLMTAVLLDSTFASGRIYGDGVFDMTKTTFTGNLQVKELAVTQIPIGELTLDMSNEKADRISTNGTLRSSDNYIDLAGNYFIGKQNPFDFTIDIKNLSAKTVEAFSFGILQKTQGDLNGKLTIKGSTDSPKINGDLNFEKVGLVLPQTQSKYFIDKQKLTFDGSNISLRNFIVKDSLNQNLVADGSISIKNLPSFSYNINLKANNFLVLNTTRKDNDFVYGQANVNPLLNVQGTDTQYKVNGKVKVNAGSQLTMIMPDDVGSEDESKAGIVKFINVKEDSLSAVNKITVNPKIEQKEAIGMGEISLNVEVDDKSELKILIDELNGDYLKAKGNANLTTEINEAGQMTMLGSYKISEGTYEMTYQVLKKPFTIKKGSEITWTGDPLKGNMNITAEYAVKAPVYDLLPVSTDKSLDVFKTEMPFSVNLIMSGELLSPKVDFDIVFDENFTNSLGDEAKSALEESLRQLRRNPVELKKQVFAVLVLNRFIPEKSSDFFSGVSAESIARQSVSKLLSEQLNNLAGDIIKGVKLDFNLASEYNVSSDYRSTNLGVGLSKSFLNERLSVSVGRNFELENAQARSNEVFDNVTVNYNLTKDGRYRFKAFRKNQFILEGFVVETGVGFTIALDFDQLKELIGKN